MLPWDAAQAQYSQGAEAMSQGSIGSPVLFLDPAACEDILADLRGEDGCLPTFSESDPGSPPPTLEAAEAHGEKATQTSPVPTHDQSTSARPTVSTVDQSTQVISRPASSDVRHTDIFHRTYRRPVHPGTAQAPTLVGLHSNGHRGQEHEVLLNPSAPSRHPGIQHRHATSCHDVKRVSGGMLF